MIERDEIRKKQYREKKKTAVYVFLIRWWSVGAVYFFIGWGTPLGRYQSILDLVFFLGLAIGIFHTLIVNPALKMLFNYGWYKPYSSSSFIERLVCRVKDFSLAFTGVIAVSQIYRGINTLAVSLFGLSRETVFLPGEPILFGLFYTVIITVILFTGSLIFKRNNS